MHTFENNFFKQKIVLKKHNTAFVKIIINLNNQVIKL